MKHFPLLVAASSLAAACSSQQTPPESAEPVEVVISADVESNEEEFEANSSSDTDPDTGDEDAEYTRIQADEKVFFETDSSELLDSGKEKLDAIAAMYDEDGEAWKTLRVAGHADHRGTESYNMDLSRERAKSVRSYLVSQGIPSEVIDLKAYGEEKPAIPSAEEPSEMQKNRRVVFDLER